MQKKIGELIFQMIPVMVGVYLGFVVSNWSENSKKKHQAEVLLESMLIEIESNEKQLQSVIDYHEMVEDSSLHYSNTKIEIKKGNFFKGTRIMKLNMSAYDTGIQTGIINELPLERIQQINQLYTFQKVYNDYSNVIMTNLLSKDFSDKEEDLRAITRFLATTMTDVVAMEKGLLEAYKKMKANLID